MRLVALLLAAGCGTEVLDPVVLGPTLWVSPNGDDGSDGRDPLRPLRSIQTAVDRAQPGDRIVLGAGVYRQDVLTRRHGEPRRRIVITGPESGEAVVQGDGKARVFEINHDHHTLQGFTIDGLWGDPERAEGYRDKLVYVLGKEPGKGVTGLRIRKMTLRNAGGECVRLRYFATDNEIADSSVRTCGVYDFRFGGGGKNGEGIYVGTAQSDLKDMKNPTADPDRSRGNRILGNFIDTQANECIDVKEGASATTIERNDCRGQRDAESAVISLQGNDNVVRWNDIGDSLGWGVRLGGGPAGEGIGNVLRDNQIHDNVAGGVRFLAVPQKQVCGNTMTNNGKDGRAHAGGTAAAGVDPTAACGAM